MYVNGKVVYITGGLVFIALMAVPAVYIYCTTPSAPLAAAAHAPDPNAATSPPAVDANAPTGAPRAHTPDYDGAGTSVNAAEASATAPRRDDGL